MISHRLEKEIEKIFIESKTEKVPYAYIRDRTIGHSELILKKALDEMIKKGTIIMIGEFFSFTDYCK